MRLNTELHHRNNTDTNDTQTFYPEESDNPSKTLVNPLSANNFGSTPLSNSFSQTPDTPSANLSPTQSSTDQSQAFTSHFTSENSLVLLKKFDTENPTNPFANYSPNSADITPTSDASPEGAFSEEIDLLKFDEDPWDLGNLDYEFQSLNIDDYFKET